jgi:tetratricopeptide (TPR) repeat protein
LFRGDAVQASGWFGRAERLLETADQDCVERGYLLIPLWLKQMASGDHAAGNTTAAEAAEIGERFGDADLMWLASDDQGRALVNQGRVEEGLRLVDGVLVAALAGELSPLITGIVYCNTIALCQDAYELRHAREWTEALTRWCERQPEMVAHNGLCLVHRAEIMQLQGAWDDALAEATRAAERFTQCVLNQLACGTAHYREGELRRLRGDFGAAEAAYREASRCGVEPQPGLALLRVAQDRVDTAAAWIRRAVGETTRPLKRVALLPAYVEIMLAVGERGRSSAWRARLSATSTRPGSSGRPPRLSSRSWGRAPTSPMSSLTSRAARPSMPTGSPRASSRCSAWSRPGVATGRSPRSSSSASTRSRATCRTSSRSWAFRRARPRRRSPSSATSSEPGRGQKSPLRLRSKLVSPSDAGTGPATVRSVP